MPDDRRGGTSGAVQAARAGGSQALYELDFADGTHLARLGPAVHRAALDEHGRAHVVAAIDVCVQLVEQVALIRNALQAAVPEVVVWIANRQLRLERRLGRKNVPVIASVRHSISP